jgi:universal stress protein E
VPFVEVIRMVLREGHDIVIKGATAAPARARCAQGVRHAPAAQVSLPGLDADGPGRRVLRHDPGGGRSATDRQPARDKLDRLVLDLATSLAERDDAEVHVAHAWYLQEEQALRHGRYTSGRQDEVDRLVERERDGHQGAVERPHGRLSAGPEANRHLLKGEPGT